MVGGLVEQQGVGPGEEDAGKFHPAPLTAGEIPQRLGEHPVGQRQVGRDTCRLSLGPVATSCDQTGLGLGVLVHGTIAFLAGGRRHGLFQVVHTVQQMVQPTGLEDPVPSQGVHVRVAWILRQVAQRTGASYRTRRRETFTGKDAGERRLAGAISAHQTNLVASNDLKTHGLEQQPGTDSNLNIIDLQHPHILPRCRGITQTASGE